MLYTKKNPIILLMIDGWGINSTEYKGNLFSSVKTPNFDKILATYPAFSLRTPFSENKQTSLPACYEQAYSQLGSGLHCDKNDVCNCSLSRILSDNNLTQFKISQVDGFSYITYFLNGKRNTPNKGEKWECVPEDINLDINNFYKMKSQDIVNTLKQKISTAENDFYVVSLQNIDVLSYRANIKTIEYGIKFVDKLLGELLSLVINSNSLLLLGSSHGFAEKIYDVQTEIINRKPSNSNVPFVMVGAEFEGITFNTNQDTINKDLSLTSPSGDLYDIMPTILKLFHLDIPENIEGKSLV